jgi:hypothetical protein
MISSGQRREPFSGAGDWRLEALSTLELRVGSGMMVGGAEGKTKLTPDRFRK